MAKEKSANDQKKSSVKFSDSIKTKLIAVMLLAAAIPLLVASGKSVEVGFPAAPFPPE